MGASTLRAGCRIVANRARCCVVVREQFVRRAFQLCVCFDSQVRFGLAGLLQINLLFLDRSAPFLFTIVSRDKTNEERTREHEVESRFILVGFILFLEDRQ